MKYDKELDDLIENNIDKNYAKFHSSLVPNTKIKGVRIPILRKIAKNYAKCNDFLENIKLDNYEKISIACYYIGITTKNTKQLEDRLNYILPRINNWAICDTFASSLKILKQKYNEFLPNLLPHLKSKNVFSIRFCVVCFLNYYMQEDKIEYLFNQLLKIQNKDYYIDMAIAWFVSVAYVKFKDITLPFLQNKKFDKTIHNKSISKICESLRIPKNDKIAIKELRYL